MQKQNTLLVLMVITDSPPLEPVPELFLFNAKTLIEVSGPEHIGVDDPVEEVGRSVGSSPNKADHHYPLRRT